MKLKNKKPSISLLIPAYNEEKLLKKTISYYNSYLRKLKLIDSYEIIICVNGSTDNTAKISKEISLKTPNIRYLVTKKKGFGIGLTLGMKTAKKEFITYMPGDGEIDAKFIEKAIKKMDDKTFVVGSRKDAGSYEGKNYFREFLSFGFNTLLTITLSSKAKEAASVKMYPTKWAKKAAKELKCYGFEWQVEIMYHALKDGLELVSVPSKVLSKRAPGESTVDPLRDSIKTFKTSLKYGYKYRLGQLFNR